MTNNVSIHLQLESGLFLYPIARYDNFRKPGMSLSSHYWGNSSISYRSLWKTWATLKPSTNERANLSIPHRCHFHLCEDGTSNSIPHRLNNSSWSTSLLHIKKQCATWVFEWAVERNQPVSCQGEHPEIISIIYCIDILQGRAKQETISTWRLHSRLGWSCTLICKLNKGIVFIWKGCKTSSFKGVSYIYSWGNVY